MSFGATEAANLGVGLVTLGAVTGIAAKEAGNVDKQTGEGKKKRKARSAMPKSYTKARKMAKPKQKKRRKSRGLYGGYL